MKTSIILVSLCLLMAAAAHAQEVLCPAGSTEVSKCVSDDVVSLYPFVSICQTDKTYVVAMDHGNTDAPDLFHAARTDSSAEVAFAVTDEDSDGMKFIIERCTCADSAKAKLSYDLFGAPMESNYTCKSQIH